MLISEAAAIKANIEVLRAKGVRYEDQVILARSHLTLARICGPLESMSVPLLYLGDLFERDEIRDLQSLLALDAEFGGVGLMRVARFPEYAIPRSDAIRVLSHVAESGRTVLEAIQHLDTDSRAERWWEEGARSPGQASGRHGAGHVALDHAVHLSCRT